MIRDEYRGSVVSRLPNQLRCGAAGVLVHRCERLVQHREFGGAGQRGRHEHLRQGATAARGQRKVGSTAQPLQQVHCERGRGATADPAQRGQPRTGGHPWWRVAERLRLVPNDVRVLHAAGHGPQDPRGQSQQRGLAAAIGATHHGDSSGWHPKGHLLQDRRCTAAKGEPDVGQHQSGAAHDSHASVVACQHSTWHRQHLAAGGPSATGTTTRLARTPQPSITSALVRARPRVRETPLLRLICPFADATLQP